MPEGRQVGMKWDRFYLCGVFWGDIEPEPGSFLWDAVDLKVNEAKAAGTEILFTIHGVPDWASTAPPDKELYEKLMGPGPKNELGHFAERHIEKIEEERDELKAKYEIGVAAYQTILSEVIIGKPIEFLTTHNSLKKLITEIKAKTLEEFIQYIYDKHKGKRDVQYMMFTVEDFCKFAVEEKTRIRKEAKEE